MDVHERLHAHPGFAAIADGTIRAAEFHRLMGLMGSFYAAFDPLVSAASVQVGRGIYCYQNRAPMFHTALGGAPDLPKIDDLSALAGAAYVVDGSVLGGQILRRAIASRLQHPYWEWCAREGASVWRCTRTLIDAADAGPEANGHAVHIANAVFSAFAGHMNMSMEEVTV